MKVNVKEFLEESGIKEPFYPGKRLVHQCAQQGDYKSHCVVLDWRDPDKIRIDVKPGLTGRDLDPKQLKYYPVSFQTPTYVEIEVLNDALKNLNDNEDDEEETKGKSSSSGGGKGAKKKKTELSDIKSLAFDAFGEAGEGKVPENGNILEMVVMGVQIAKEAFGAVFETFKHQVSHAKVSATDLLAHAGEFVTKYTPPEFMQPKGDETAQYKYDREKNADIGYRPGLG